MLSGRTILRGGRGLFHGGVATQHRSGRRTGILETAETCISPKGEIMRQRRVCGARSVLGFVETRREGLIWPTVRSMGSESSRSRR